MATLISVTLENYRSIQEPLRLAFPSSCPAVLLGENNCGKSNIVKGINLLLGEFWPGSHDPEDHEFYDRDRMRNISITAEFSPSARLGRYSQIRWMYDSDQREPVFRGYPGRYGNFDGFISGDDRDGCVCVVLEAERNLGYQLSYSSKFTLLSKLMHKFHKVLAERGQIKAELESLFENIKMKFSEIPEFAEFTGNLRSHLSNLVGTMTHRLEVDFEAYNPTNFFHALRLQAHDGTSPRVLAEMGTGESQILAISFAHAFATAFHGGILLVVEEPESHLHPLAQQWLARKVHELCDGGLQMLITTHSPHFIDIMSLDGLILVTKDTSGTHVVQMSASDLAQSCIEQGAPAERVTATSILPFYRSSATPEILEGFLAKAVVLVEGPTEKLALPIYLERSGLSPARDGVAVIPVYGKGSLAKWRRLLTAYHIPVYIIFDNDEEDDSSRNKRKDALMSVGVLDDEFEEFLSSEDFIISDLFCVFGNNFERTMRRLFPEYASLEAEAVENGGSGKPFVARYVAERIPYVATDRGWLKFTELSEKIRSLLPVNRA